MKRVATLWIVLAVAAHGLAASPTTLTDGRGRTVTLQQSPQRVVSLAPSTTEIVYALGAGERLVGRTRFCDFPPEVSEVPVIGAIQGTRPEALLTHRPDLVLVSDLTPPSEIERMERLRLQVLVLNHHGLDGIFQDIELAGRALGRTEAAQSLNAQLQSTRDQVRQRLAGIAPEEYPRVLLTFGPLEIYAPGGGTYPDRLLREAGGRNIAANASSPWPKLSLEAILEADPQVIFVSVDPDDHPELDSTALLQRYRAHDAWKRIDAVQQGKVYRLDADRLNRPGPRAISLLPEVAERLHPPGD
ncbi:MAG: ABC transporter substrate-binding protein [Opitutales bacterium]